MANFGIFDSDVLELEGDTFGSLLIINDTEFINIFAAVAQRDYRQFPDDGLRNHPGPVDLKRKWPQV